MAVPAGSPGSMVTLSHVNLARVADVRTDGVDCCAYDDGNGELLVATSTKLHSWHVPRGAAWEGAEKAPDDGPNITFLSAGPVVGVRFSLDKSLLAIQRSDQEIEFVNRGDAAQFYHRCRGQERILGFFWALSAFCDICFVTTSGLELYVLLESRRGLKLVDSRKHAVNWFKYSHATRMVLLSTGPLGRRIHGYQLAAEELVKLPKFDIAAVAKADKDTALDAGDVALVNLYGRLYCCLTDRRAQELVLYRLFKDSVTPQHRFRVYSAVTALCVVDSVLVAIHMEEQVALMFDVLGASDEPVSAPLAIGVEASGQEEGFEPEGAEWAFMPPDVVVGLRDGLMWRVTLDLEAVRSSITDPVEALSFLQRRDEGRGASDPRALSVQLVTGLIADRAPLPTLQRAFDILCRRVKAQQAADLPTSTPAGGKPGHAPGRRPAGSALAPEVLLREVFGALGRGRAAPAALLAAVETYMLSAAGAGLPLPEAFPRLVVDLLLAQGKAFQVQQYVALGGLEKSAALADHLAAAAAADPEAFAEGAEMATAIYGQAGDHDAQCRALLKRGRLLEALRIVRKHRLADSVRPLEFLDEALAAGPATVFTAIFRFCSWFVPGFDKHSPRYLDKVEAFVCGEDEP